MKYTKLGNSELEVSRICMGCMGFGNPYSGQHSWTLDEQGTDEIIKKGLSLGVNFFDTAIAYQGGTSEPLASMPSPEAVIFNVPPWNQTDCYSATTEHL